MKLSDLQNKDKAIIIKIRGRGAFRKRIIEMGFIKGKEVEVIKNAPLKDPIEYKVLGYEISLRRSEAELIEVVLPSQNIYSELDNYEGTISDDVLKISLKEKQKTINVALVGNPNCGKTTLFNFASGAKEHVGNYSGVTVDSKLAKFKQGTYKFNIVDLPGTYSLTAYSPEEIYVRNYIFEEIPDIVINVLDASNIERNLYLTTQLIDMDIKVVIALNMYDEMIDKGDKLDYTSLGKMIGIPIVPTIGSKGKGIKELFDKVIDVYEDKDPIVRHIHINYGKPVENAIQKIQTEIKNNLWLTDKISSRFLSIKLIEKDKNSDIRIKKCDNYNKIIDKTKDEIIVLENQFKEDSETLITDAKYGFISGAIKETFKEGSIGRNIKTQIIDTFLTHRLFGFPVFIFFMWLMFQSTFSLGQYPMDWIEFIVSQISNLFSNYMPNGMLKDLIVDGILAGVGGVIVFLPNILILFFFISLMEDTGYMARVAFIMDKLMHFIGLHGKSFIPLIMGFGCNVPAIMATRTLENKNDRLLTMLINPLMSCSARLPVYLILIGAIFPDNAGTLLFSIYMIGIFLAIIVALIFKKILFRSEETPFVMELPPYRIPTLKSTLIHMWNKGSQYLKKMGGIILIASIIIWALGYFPRQADNSSQFDKKIKQINIKYDNIISLTNDSIINKTTVKEKDSIINIVRLQKEANRQKNSYIGRLGHFIEPVMKPLGFDWKMSVSIVSGIAAKEIVVSTLSVLYQANVGAVSSDKNLIHKLKNEKHSSGSSIGKPVYTPLVTFSLILFTLIYFPCIATVVTIKNESGSWKWSIFMIMYTTTLAWTVSFLVYQIGSLFM